MKTARNYLLSLAVLTLFAGPVHAQDAVDPAKTSDTTSSATKQADRANRDVRDAVAVVRKLGDVDKMRSVLNAAKGIFIVPSYGRAALAVGADGGSGVLLVRRADGGWSDPVFYGIGGLSVGLQAGVQGGALVLVLNNEKAVHEFLKKNNFSMNAKAGLTVVNWNKMVQGTAGTGDVLAWSDTKGLFGDLATVEVDNIRYNQKLTNAYYRRTLAASDVIDGKTANPQAASLVQTLSTAADAAH